MTETNAATATLGSEVSSTALPYDLDAIAAVFAANNRAMRESRAREVAAVNEAFNQGALERNEIDAANEKLLAGVLAQLAFYKDLLKQERDINARMKATIDAFTRTVAAAVNPLEAGMEDAQARSHTVAELERKHIESYDPPKVVELGPSDDGGGNGGGVPHPKEEPRPEVEADALTAVTEEFETSEDKKPDPVMPLAPAAREKASDDLLEIPAFLRRNRPHPSETTVEPPPEVEGHAEELFHKTAAVVVAAAQHVGEAARGHFGRRAA